MNTRRPRPEAGEAIVRVEMAGICERTCTSGWRKLAIPLPVILGHETADRIEKLGAGLDKNWRGNPLAEGDRVTWASSLTCGECYYCRLKQRNHNRILG